MSETGFFTLMTLKFFLDLKTSKASSVKEGAMMISKNILFNSSAVDLLTSALNAIIPFNIETVLHSYAFFQSSSTEIPIAIAQSVECFTTQQVISSNSESTL